MKFYSKIVYTDSTFKWYIVYADSPSSGLNLMLKEDVKYWRSILCKRHQELSIPDKESLFCTFDIPVVGTPSDEDKFDELLEKILKKRTKT